MSFSAIILTGIFLNWFLYSRHEQVDRVYPEEIIETEQVVEEKEQDNSIDLKANENY